jgi:NAD(P)-dependent dehydrogenase (short-subunit alcohol dehydrogenase family)
MFDLAQRIALVTGACGNLGQAVCKRFLGLGAQVVAADLDADLLASLYADLPMADRIATLAGHDLTDERQASSLVAEATRRFSGLHIVVNTVGTFAGGKSVVDEDLDVWRLLWRLNVQSALHVSRAAAPILLRHEDSPKGRIINVASTSALCGAAGVAAYSATKSALLRLTEALAEELKKRGVTVNAVLPSTLDTPANREAMPDADFSSWVLVDDVAAAVAFLASECARSITGASLPIAGTF